MLFIGTQFSNIYTAAMEKCLNPLKFIPKDLMTDEIIKYAVEKNIVALKIIPEYYNRSCSNKHTHQKIVALKIIPMLRPN